MKLQSQLRGDAVHVVVDEERIDSAVAIRFKEAVREQAADGPARVVLDLRNVEFLDSSGLGAVVAVMKLIGAGRQLELCNLTPNVDKVFRLTRMDRVFTIHDTYESAFPERQTIA
ncbi:MULTISPECIES: STAS domain-containing protein [Rhodovulum]|uniref:Anti-sigma factor antagonist n=2 Tax=Rhodovulum TaxID=34008 RepID=A0A8E3ARY7_9RHOB|nr:MULTISPECIES: STAS domain-containing protein [Rhodovulum]PTW51559.1 anti-sigma B factor antagonist [Rhodovulum kholense]RAP43070.1 anti-anti-sigma factor [Rhodovulum viride]